MIKKFSINSALLLIDPQRGVDNLDYWGGATGRRNNPDAEKNIKALLEGWRAANLPVIFTKHDSREQNSPLKWALESGNFKSGLEPIENEVIIWKDVNSGFIGTTLELELQRAQIHRLVIAGFFTNFCVETTTRMAGNLGYDAYLVHDACATTNRIGPDGVDHDPDQVHQLSIASLHGEFCTSIDHIQALELLHGDNADLSRAQGNE